MGDVIEDIQVVKSDDKKDIEMEEREKMLNEENKVQEANTGSETLEEKKKEIMEGMEVKPKKIPIGGIQMPGFFTRSKSKEKCKEDSEQADIEGTELINKDQEQNGEEKPETVPKKIKLPALFKKTKKNDDEGDQSADPKPKKSNFLNTIVSKLPIRKKEAGQPLDQSAQAGLASMETLDDKSTDGKSNHELKNVALDDNKDVEKQEEGSNTWLQKLLAYKVAAAGFFCFLLLLVIILAFTLTGYPPASPPIRDGRYIKTVTSCGPVEGLLEDSAFAFRGIPYARPPLGEFRFRNAQSLNRQEYCHNGTFLAHNSSDYCMQIYDNGTVAGAEDCLTLDVVTPKVRYDNPLPVIVLIGADSFMGGSPGKMRPSARYSRSRDVVFVRPNFRLGALGFLALNELTTSEAPMTSGNYGLSDILEALKWIQLNIVHFGGDNSSVTLFGHKAGATLVTALATIKDARKYFARAWASSGSAIYPDRDLAEAEIDFKSILETLNCKDRQCLQDIDAEKLVTAVEDTWRKPQPDLPSADEEPGKRHKWMVMDGRIVKENPATIWAKDEDLPVKLVIGTTAHADASQKLLMKHTNWTEELVRKHISESFLQTNNLTEKALGYYGATYQGLTAMISDIRTVCPLYAISTQMHKVPFYVVEQNRGAENVSDVDSDVEAILGRYEPKTPEQRRYFSAMQGLFYHYVWHGSIEHNLLPGNKVLVVGQDVLANASYGHCAFWITKNVVLKYAALD